MSNYYIFQKYKYRAAEEESGGHWVTIDGNPVFIKDNLGDIKAEDVNGRLVKVGDEVDYGFPRFTWKVTKIENEGKNAGGKYNLLYTIERKVKRGPIWVPEEDWKEVTVIEKAPSAVID